MALKQGKTFIYVPFIFLLAFILGLSVFIMIVPSRTASAETITYNIKQKQESYGNSFWGSDATVLPDGRLRIRGTVLPSGVFKKDEAPNDCYLVYEPYGILSGGTLPDDMVKLTDINGKIIASPGTYTLSAYADYFMTYDYADIYQADGDNLGVKIYDTVQFTDNPKYQVLKRDVTVNVDDSSGVLRFYGGPSIDLNYIITSGNMVNDDLLSVDFVSLGNAQEAGVGEYDIELDSFSITNGELNKENYYSVTYSATGRPSLIVEKYVISALGLGDIEDFYRYDGDHSELFLTSYEDVAGINNETVRIFYTLDEAGITRVKGALPVSGEGEGYPTLVDYDRIEVYDEAENLVLHKENYEIDSTANNTRLVVNKRNIELYSGIGVVDEDGLYIESEVVSETYGYNFTETFNRNIEVYGETIDFELSFATYSAMPEAGEWELTLINADNPFYIFTLNESFEFVIEKYTLRLFDYIDGEGETKYVNVAYGAGLPEYGDTVQVEEAFEEVAFLLYSDVTANTEPGEHDFTGYLESRNFIIDYTGVKILVARKPLSITVESPRPAGIEYGDEYSLIFEGLVSGYDATLVTSFSLGAVYNASGATAGLPVNAGAYRIRCTIDAAAMEFYTLSQDEYLDVSLNIAKRNIIVKYDINYSSKEYGTAITSAELGTLSDCYESDPEEPGLLNGDTLSGSITCGGLAENAQVGTYVINTSNLNNDNYNISGGITVYYNETPASSLRVVKLAAENLPVFAATLSSSNATSVTLANINILGKPAGSFTISANGGSTYGAYQTNNTFTGLAPGKKYYFKARIKGDNNIEQGAESAPLMVATTLTAPTIKGTNATVNSVTLELNEYSSVAITYYYLYRLNSGEWGDENEFEDLSSGTRYQIRYKCVSADGIESSSESTYIWTHSAAPEIVVEELPIDLQAESIMLAGLEDIYEFRIGIEPTEGEDVQFSSWTTAGEFTELEQLTTYVIEIRVRASATNGNIAGESSSFSLSTPELIIVEEPIHYDGIMAYVADYFIVGLLVFVTILMLLFIFGFARKFKFV